MKNRILLKQLVIDALFIALMAVFTYVPYIGYITLGPISFTTVHVLVILGAALYGYKRGLLYGTVMGIFSLIKAINYPGVIDYLFVDPLISVLPRALFGLFTGLIFDALRKHVSQEHFNYLTFIVSPIMTFVHTLLTLSSLYVFGILLGSNEGIWTISKALGLVDIVTSINNSYSSFWVFILSFVSLGALAEMVVSLILVPTCYIIIHNSYGIGGVTRKDKQIIKKSL
ncbi:MAG: ECF transporter S component [Bacilli bacterium]